MIANAPSAPPSAIEPVSPMKTSAGKALYQRKPIAPPISAAPRIARSSYVSSRGGPAAPERIHAITVIAVNVKRAMIPVPGGEAVEPVGEVHAVRGAGDHEEEQHVPGPRELEVADRPGCRPSVVRCWWCAA